MHKVSRTQHGMSLVELMVGMMLGLILVAGLIQIFASNKRSFSLAEAMAQTQESGRKSSDMLARAIRNAGYWGCLSADSQVVNNLRDVSGRDDDLRFDASIEVYQAAPNEIPGAMDNAHVLVVRGVDAGSSVRVNRVPATEAATLAVDGTGDLQEEEIVLVSDCQAAHIFQITGIPNSTRIQHSSQANLDPGNRVAGLGRIYTEQASVYRVFSERYYIAEDDDGWRALVRQPISLGRNKDDTVGLYGEAQELVSGVQDLRMQLGLDTNGDGAVDDWVDPPVGSDNPQLANLSSQAVAVRFSVLSASSEDNAVEQAQAYCFPSWARCDSESNGLIQTSDRRLYRAMARTATIRNRTLGG